MSILPSTIYPATANDRDRWILERRPARATLDPWRPYSFCVEEEAADSGEIVPVATVFLTNRECPWRCLMCDLWRNTLPGDTPLGAIPAQIEHALDRLGSARHIKLYNSGSFFDSRAVPAEDHARIAGAVSHFERVIVECHPALIGKTCFTFRRQISGRLEVAMGLETVQPEVLARLNKGMTLDQFRVAARKLMDNGIDLRVFVLVKPPFTNDEEALFWAQRSIDEAFDAGASVVSLIPTRAGNGAMDELSRHSEFAPPRLETVEKAEQYGLSLRRGRVFVDLWDTQLTDHCEVCYEARIARLRDMNLRQMIADPVRCRRCGGSA